MASDQKVYVKYALNQFYGLYCESSYKFQLRQSIFGAMISHHQNDLGVKGQGQIIYAPKSILGITKKSFILF